MAADGASAREHAAALNVDDEEHEGPRRLEYLEIRLLLQAMYEHHGVDFRDYAPASLRRRLLKRLEDEGLASISQLQHAVLHDSGAMERLLHDLSITVTAMFRDPSFYAVFRQKVVPLLRTYPFIRIWNAGCSTGEETHSLAIVLAEEGLLERCRIYATDINDRLLQRARAGIFPLERMREYTGNYQRAGGLGAFSDYYTAAADGAHFDRALHDHIVFAQHNLATDGVFNEFHLIVCRNVMIYFTKGLQDRVHGLFRDSLIHLGVLALGQRESLRFTQFEREYRVLDADAKLYRRIAA